MEAEGNMTWIKRSFAINSYKALLNSVLPFLHVGIFGAAIFPRKVLQQGHPATALSNLGERDYRLNT